MAGPCVKLETTSVSDKSIKGKVHSIHLGRKIDIEKAKLKIQEKWKRIYENDPTLRPCT